MANTASLGSIAISQTIVTSPSFGLTGNTSGNTTVSGNDIYFSGGNGITVSGTSNSIIFSMNPSGGGLTNINASAGTTSNNLSNIVFSNSNGVSFGLNGSTITASVNAGGAGVSQLNGSQGTISLQVASSLSASTNGSTISFGLASNITTALQSAGNYLTTAMLSNQGSSVYFSGNTTAQTSSGSNNGTAMTFLMNGLVSGGMSGQSIVISAPASTIFQQASQMSNYAGTNTTFNGDNISGSITLNSNGLNLSLSAATAAPSPVNVSAGTTSDNLASIVFSNSNNVSFGLNGSTITATVNVGGANTISTYIPYYPASTGVQTLGAQGVTSASAWFFPISVVQPVVLNRLEQLMTASVVSSSVAFSHTVTHQFGIFSNNAGTLSLISSNSYSVAITGSSASHTLSCPVSYDTGGGYTYTTFAATTTAQAQSLFGTAGNRIMTFGFGDTMSLSDGLYWLGIYQRQSSSSANGGMAFALAGNVMAAPQNAGGLGSSTAAYTGTNNTLYKIPWGVATSTGSAGYGGSQLPNAVNITAMGMTVTVMPMMTFISR